MNIMALLRAKSTVAYLVDTCTVRQGLEKLRAHGYTAIPVVREDGSYAGSISEGDFLWHILETGGDIHTQEEYRISRIIRPDWNPAARIDVTLTELMERILRQNFIPMVDDRNLFIGIITRQDILRSFTEKQYAALETMQKDAAPYWLETVCEKMRAHENFSDGLGRMVELSGKTREHLARSMRKYKNITASAFVNNLRLDYVADMLVNSDKSIVDLCYESGFASLDYFGKQFKKKYGMAPSKYRAVMKEESK